MAKDNRIIVFFIVNRHIIHIITAAIKSIAAKKPSLVQQNTAYHDKSRINAIIINPKLQKHRLNRFPALRETSQISDRITPISPYTKSQVIKIPLSEIFVVTLRRTLTMYHVLPPFTHRSIPQMQHKNAPSPIIGIFSQMNPNSHLILLNIKITPYKIYEVILNYINYILKREPIIFVISRIIAGIVTRIG